MFTLDYRLWFRKDSNHRLIYLQHFWPLELESLPPLDFARRWTCAISLQRSSRLWFDEGCFKWSMIIVAAFSPLTLSTIILISSVWDNRILNLARTEVTFVCHFELDGLKRRTERNLSTCIFQFVLGIENLHKLVSQPMGLHTRFNGSFHPHQSVVTVLSQHDNCTQVLIHLVQFDFAIFISSTARIAGKDFEFRQIWAISHLRLVQCVPTAIILHQCSNLRQVSRARIGLSIPLWNGHAFRFVTHIYNSISK